MEATISNSRGVSPYFLFRVSWGACFMSSRRVCTRSETHSRPTQCSPSMTLRIPFNSTWVAESFITTPRAPSCSASTICALSMAAVSTMVRTEPGESASCRRASRPGMRGMARSRSRMSGLSLRACLTASSPSDASPTTRRSDSASSRRRKPSRKMGCSSAIRMRISVGALAIEFLREGDFQARSSSGHGIDGELAVDGADAFLDHHRATAPRVKVSLRQMAREVKSMAVIIHHQLAVAVGRVKAHQDVFGPAVLAYVYQRLLKNSRHLDGDARGQVDFLQGRSEGGRDARVAPEFIHRVNEEIQELFGADVHRHHLLHQ